MQRPTVLPFIDTTLSNVDPDYQNNTLNLVGFAPGDVIPSKIHNTLWLLDSLWVLHFDHEVVRASDVIDATTVQRMSSTDLAYTIGDNVLGGGGAAVDTFTTLFLEGQRIDVDNYLLRLAGASPLLVVGATVPGRIWIYVDATTINPPGTPLAAVRVESAGPGAAASPAGSEHALVGVDIDAGGFVTGNVYDAVPTDRLVYNTREQQWNGRTYFDNVATFNDDVSIAGELYVALPTTLDNELAVTGPATFSNTVTCNGTVTINDRLTIANSAMLTVQAGATLAAGNNTWVWGSSNVNDWTISGNVTLGTDPASVITLNGAVAVSDVLSTDLDMDGNNVLNPSRIAFTTGVLPLNAGQLTAGTGGVLRYQPAGSAHYVHTTDRGYVLGLGATANGGVVAGASVAGVSQIAVTPPATGKVEVSFSGYLDFSTTATTARIFIRDVTAAVVLNGAGLGLIEYPIVIGVTPFGHSVSGSITYTLPSTATRTFELEIAANVGDVTYTDFTLKVIGVTV